MTHTKLSPVNLIKHKTLNFKIQQQYNHPAQLVLPINKFPEDNSKTFTEIVLRYS